MALQFNSKYDLVTDEGQVVIPSYEIPSFAQVKDQTKNFAYYGLGVFLSRRTFKTPAEEVEAAVRQLLSTLEVTPLPDLLEGPKTPEQILKSRYKDLIQALMNLTRRLQKDVVASLLTKSPDELELIAQKPQIAAEIARLRATPEPTKLEDLFA